MSVSICVGCLSHDRRLTPLAERHAQLWWLVSEQIYSSVGRLQLCWECLGFISKLERFKRRAALASDTLSKHLNQQAQTTPSLSQLATSATQLTCAGACYSASAEPTLRSFRPADRATDLFHTGDTKYLPNNTARFADHFTAETQTSFRTFGNSTELRIETLQTNLTKFENTETAHGGCGSTTNPLFVKVEDDAIEGDDDVEECLDGEVKSEPEQLPVEVDVSGAAARGGCSGDEFSDSDEEPLRRPALPPAPSPPPSPPPPPRSKGRRKKDKGAAAEGAAAAGEGRVLTNKKALRKLQQLQVPEGLLQVVELTWAQVEEERSRARASDAFQRLRYKCESCVVGFNHGSKLDVHRRKHAPAPAPAQPGAAGVVCRVCDVLCASPRALAAHLRRHRVRWRCTRCGLGWSRAAVAADHARRVHGAPPPRHRCGRDDCAHVAASLAALRLHMKSHGARVSCDLCGKSFRDRASLRTHLFIHGGVKEFSCPTCHKQFLFKKAMEVHMVTHDAPAHLYCHECDVTFKNRMSYYGHMKYNLKHIDPAMLKHECAECGKRFAKAARLREHRAAIHLHLTPERCDHPGCSFACASRPVLRAHRRAAHARGGRVPKRDHVCHTCGKAYTTKTSLEGHLRAHAGARPLRCALCPAAFSYEAALYNHTRRVHKLQSQPKAPLSVPSAAVPVDSLTPSQ